jgi:hypothetical protein
MIGGGFMEKFDLESINSMDGHEFENLISKLLINMKFKVEQTKKTADGGIDIFAYNEEPVVGGKYIVQCKRSSSPISESVVRDLYGVVTAERASKGILITNANFSSASTKFSENKPIELIDGYKLVNLLVKHFDFGKNIQEPEMPKHQELLYRAITKSIAVVKKDYREIKAGLVFQNKKHIQSNESYVKFFDNKNTNLIQFTEVFSNLMDSFNESPEEDMKDISQFVKSKIDNLNLLVRGLFGNWKDMFFTQYPDDFENVHKTMLKIYDSIFTSLFSWMAVLSSALDDPKGFVDKNNEATLTFAFDNDVIGECSESISGELERIRNIHKPSKGCFIATACYGYDSWEVALLRQFRDKMLLKNYLGVLFVNIYYMISPPIANFIGNRVFMKTIFRFLLSGVISFVKHTRC